MKPVKKKKPAKKSVQRNSTKAVTAPKVKRIAAKNSNPRLTRQLQAQVMKVYETYWHNYLIGNVEAMAPLLANEYTQVGSAESEVFFTKKDAVKFLYDTIGQVAGKVEMRKRMIKVEPHQEFILVTELTDLYVLIEKEWTFHSKFRASSLMQQKDEGWKFIHQHSSFPDIRAEEGDNIAIEKIAAENLQLRDAVKRRTVELEQKNRELEIEAAMEKVRVRSLAMQKPDELVQVAEVLRKEMGALGVEELETSSIYIIDENKGTTECWYAIKDIRGKNKKLVTDHMTLRLEETWVGRQMKKFHRSKENRASIVMKGEDRKEWINHCAEKSSVLQGYYGMEIPERTYHLLKFSNGFMGAASPGEISRESWDLLQRATAVFSFAYKRFSDLQKAEAQAREAQIEVALERVRSRSMAMHSSTELKDVITVVMAQFKQLGFPVDLANFNYLSASHDWTMWLATTDYAYPEIIHVPYLKHPLFDRPIDTFMKGLDFMSDLLTREEKDSAMHHFYQTSVLGSFDNAERKKMVEEGKGLARSIAFMKHITLTISNFNAIPYTDEQNVILKRFAHVFEQSYTRFLDLQKAEAQAREAKIETTLEKVRSRTMAMQKSEELSQAANLLFQQMQVLEIPTWSAGYCIWDDENKQSATFWMSSDGMLQPPFSVPLTENSMFIHYREAYLRGEEYYAEEFAGEELVKHYQYMMANPDIVKMAEQMVKAGIEMPVFPVYQVNHVVYFSNGFLLFVTLQPVPEAHSIFKRFGKVFDQTYTRFLDLQKAEAQAREAQIEAALERVRAQTMAMHNSEDVGKCVVKMFSELTALGVHEGTRFGIGILNHDNVNNQLWTARKDGEEVNMHIGNLDMTLHPLLKSVRKAWKEQVPLHQYVLEGEDLLNYYKMINNAPDYKLQVAIEKLPEREFHYGFIFNQGFFYAFSPREFQPELIHITQRFAKVFDQTYTRFLDLKKAEAQAREAQIEAAVERVRADAMAMHSTSDFEKVTKQLLKQLKFLNLDSITGTSICLIDEDQFMSWWDFSASGNIGDPKSQAFRYDAKKYQILGRDVLKKWQEGEPYMVLEFNMEKLFAAAKEWEDIDENISNTFKKLISEGKLTHQWNPTGRLSNGFLTFDMVKPPDDDVRKITIKMAQAFEQAYTRFLDLQKAEAQAREAQIETALEKVRSSMMAMHKTEELHHVLNTIFDQLQFLNFNVPGSAIIIYDQDMSAEHWMTGFFGNYPESYKIPYVEHPYFTDLLHAWQRSVPFQEFFFEGDAKIEYAKWCLEHSDFKRMPPEFKKEMLNPARMVISDAFNKYGMLEILGDTSLSQDAVSVLKRFSKVFEQAYTRFLDLQKAEALAREAQIEAALERVRSRTMAMQKSDELAEAALLLFQQVGSLGTTLWTCGFNIWDEDRKSATSWMAGEGKLLPPFKTSSSEHIFLRFYEAAQRGESFYVLELKGEAIEAHYRYMQALPGIGDIRRAQVSSGIVLPTIQIIHIAFFTQGYLMFITFEPVPEMYDVFKRFAKVFEQTYTRFLDLQKAEAQAREAIIEAALEKVRGKAMAMHNSNDLLATAGEVFTELRRLGIKPIRCGVGLLNGDSKTASLYHSISTEKGDEFLYAGTAPLEGHPVIAEIYDSASRGEPCFPVLKGELLRTYYEKVLSNSTIPDHKPDYAEYGYFLSFNEGFFYGWSGRPIAEKELKILNRFKTIIDLTFRRYIELQKAEANALEAIRSASLDRVRAETASMRTTGDLEKITPLIWNELTTFGVPFIRCGVYIVDEEHEQIHTFLSTPDGNAIGAFHLPFSATHGLSQVLLHWRRKEVYKDHWDEAAFIDWTKSLVQHGAITPSEKYVTENLPTNLYLHFLPFLQGMLYVGNTAALSDEHLQLAQTLADAFSTAYARYEDFNKLELAKAQLEKTLTDLKQTQAQLVQSEKMASLGELTAGIAHEIQNPLNFVNNFSEVNTELIKEILDERCKPHGVRDEELEHDLLKDISINQEKINHHGKRAADIVKGMLQHSRRSSGVKEPTDINALAEEYLRLAYHGLRAKDKSFNAIMKTDFDESIGQVNVIPQDIGRVILNLINNAFYAVSEKGKAESMNYEPTVSIITKKGGDKILISVIDNGNGIPQKVLDKIFQPFFTTKPTGQGTGLGLSLSYDIVKAHGGELKVETSAGLGSTFTVIIPVNG